MARSPTPRCTRRTASAMATPIAARSRFPYRLVVRIAFRSLDAVREREEEGDDGRGAHPPAGLSPPSQRRNRVTLRRVGVGLTGAPPFRRRHPLYTVAGPRRILTGFPYNPTDVSRRVGPKHRGASNPSLAATMAQRAAVSTGRAGETNGAIVREHQASPDTTSRRATTRGGRSLQAAFRPRPCRARSIPGRRGALGSRVRLCSNGKVGSRSRTVRAARTPSISMYDAVVASPPPSLRS